MSRIDIYVPWNEKDEAKQLGAHWDPTTKVWYIPEGANPTALLNRWNAIKGRLYIRVPWEDKDVIKRLGGRWDYKKKTWYIPDDVDPSPILNLWPAVDEQPPSRKRSLIAIGDQIKDMSLPRKANDLPEKPETDLSGAAKRNQAYRDAEAAMLAAVTLSLRAKPTTSKIAAGKVVDELYPGIPRAQRQRIATAASAVASNKVDHG